ncbi:hypothetical protein ACLRGF_12340 [Mycetocola zhadangensis]|uniref:hypothetical protein n=1 Tax=Mycetocola zhadangensis TaxID=1164595 RepID=UPI003A4D5349
MATNKNSQSGKSAWGGDGGDGQYLALGISLGLSVGVALSLVLVNWAFMGAGLAIGVAIGVSLDASKKEKTEGQMNGGDARSSDGAGDSGADGSPGGPTPPRRDE